MRLRQLVLALIALTGACGAVLMHRSHEPSALPMAVAAVPQPATPTVGLRVRRIPGLERPAAALPIVESSAGVHVRTPAPRPARRPAKQRATKHEASGSTPGSTAVIPQDTRVAAVTPPPGLEPLAIHDAQVVAITSSSARITWRTNVPTERRQRSASTRRRSGRRRAGSASSTTRASSAGSSTRRAIRCISTRSTSGIAPRVRR
jgi:hypothetical protein